MTSSGHGSPVLPFHDPDGRSRATTVRDRRVLATMTVERIYGDAL